MIVADPREGRSRRADGMTVQINVCEHPTPVAELRRVYNTISRTLGYRSLQQFSGPDIWQLKVILHALGYYRAEESPLEIGDEAQLYTNETIEAMNAFRTDQGLATALRGFVDPQTVELLWQQLEMRGIADQIRMDLLETTSIRR